jgi:hypothetical protein
MQGKGVAVQITVTADWKTYDEPLRFDKELRIAGLFASIEFRGDVYEWRLREEESLFGDIASGWVDSFAEAIDAAEAAIRKHLE